MANPTPTPSVPAKSNKQIVHYQGANHGSIVLAKGKRITLPHVTSDADELKELRLFEKRHPALVIESVTDYELRLEKAAKAAVQATTGTGE